MEENLETQAPTEEKELSMDETIAETLKDIQLRDEPAPEEGDETAPPLAKARDEKGKFVAKQSEVIPDKPVAQTNQIDQQAIQRLGFKKEEIAEFEKASPALQQAMLRRSDEMHRGVEQYRSRASFGEQVMRAIQPYEATIRSVGIAPDAAISALFNVDHKLRYGSAEEKQQTITTLAQAYGVDLAALAEGQPKVDPQIVSLQQQLQALQQQQYNFGLSQQEAQNQALMNQINEFSKDKEFFEQVAGEMGALLQAGVATTLEDAYDRAVYANPSTRQAVTAKQRAEEDLRRKEEAAQKIAAAKKAASVNVSTRGNIPSAAPVGSMEDTIRETYRSLVG